MKRRPFRWWSFGGCLCIAVAVIACFFFFSHLRKVLKGPPKSDTLTDSTSITIFYSLNGFSDIGLATFSNKGVTSQKVGGPKGKWGPITCMVGPVHDSYAAVADGVLFIGHRGKGSLGGLKKVTLGMKLSGPVAISPDGTRVLLTAQPKGTFRNDLFILTLATAKVNRIFRDVDDGGVAWSSKSNIVSFRLKATDPSSESEVCLLDLNDIPSGPKPLGKASGAPFFSQDGRTLVWMDAMFGDPVPYRFLDVASGSLKIQKFPDSARPVAILPGNVFLYKDVLDPETPIHYRLLVGQRSKPLPRYWFDINIAPGPKDEAIKVARIGGHSDAALLLFGAGPAAFSVGAD